jgi:hypothetical protein
MGAVNALAGLIFTGGVLVGLCISIFTLRAYYAESLKQNIEEYRLKGRIEINGYKKRMEEMEKELNELKEKYNG